MQPDSTSSAATVERPRDAVTYFGGYAGALRLADRYVHIFRDGDEDTFCGVVGDMSFATPSKIGWRKCCSSCFADCQQVRRDA